MTAPTDATSLAAQVPTSVSEVLYEAANIVELHGWGFGPDSMFGKSGVCIMGALHVAIFGTFGDNYMGVATCPAGRAVWEYLNLDPDNDDAMWEWNDAHRRSGAYGSAPIRTQAEVIEVLRATAVMEAAKEAPTEAHEKAAEGVAAGVA